ncbi:MAG: hypothetical protein QOE58_2824 [Actinomycetota bacterium]|nr:hypothetical protein [Actinomycetota bacterium]
MRQWRPLAIRLGLDFDHDPHWPELAGRLSSLSRAGLDVSGMVSAAVAEKPLPDEQGAAALWWRLSRHLSPAAVTATGGSGAETLRPPWAQELVASLGELRAGRVMADPAWPALVAAVNRAVGCGWAPQQLLTDIDAGHGQRLPAADLGEALVWRVAALTDPEPLHGYEPPPDPADEVAPQDLHLLEVDDRDLYATSDLNGALPRSNDEPSKEHAAPEVESSDEALFHAARQREYAPEPDFVAFDTERQLVEANRWDHALVPEARLLELNEMAAAFFTDGYADSWGPQYVTSRIGTDLTDHPTFRPGYAPAGWTNLTDHLRRLGASDEEILAAGLARVASTGNIIDQFRDRLIMPIRNRGEIHGFIGRRNPNADDDGKAGPKYLNTAQTDLFDKSAQLFGLCEGRTELDSGATPVLVEGFFDAIAVSVAGDGRYVGVAPLGTSFTQAQANQLRPYIGPERPGVIVATDADLAGEVAAQRAFWMLTARGDTPLHMAIWDGQDPAEILELAGPEALQARLNNAAPLARHLLDERLNHLTGAPQLLPDCAAVIAAQPPHTWVQQIEYLTARTIPGPGVVRQEVANAAQRWTIDPLVEAQGQISHIASVRARLQRAAQAPLSSDRQAELLSNAAAAATRRLHSGQSGELNSNHATAAAGTTTQELPPLEVWRELIRGIDSRVTTGEDWPMLARAIQEAEAAGCDVARELSQLATREMLSEGHPATEMAYRLRAATQTTNIEPIPGPYPKQAEIRSAAHSPLGTRPSRPDPARPTR